MNISLLLHTVSHLRPKQVVYQVFYRVYKPRYKKRIAPKQLVNKNLSVSPIAREYCWDEMNNTFIFLHLKDKFGGWNDTSKGMLWTYNLNYMDWLNQQDIPVVEGIYWINKFITDLPNNHIGLDPYPIALRGINWMKFILCHQEELDKQTMGRWHDSLYAQYLLLSKKLEYHLMGNHLLEDAYSLYMAALYFEDQVFFSKASRLLLRELKEQVLPDGAHYEQSPMYHCILLDRLLDCYNFSINMNCFPEQQKINSQLKNFAIRMLGHLQNIVYRDGTIPLLNDSAYGIAPVPAKIFNYASSLGLIWNEIVMKDCGYRKFYNGQMEAIVDVGNLAASYQPGHSHADTFNYELRIAGKPFIVDTGISTYNKTKRRLYERSTAAHNTVTVNNRDSSEVWSGFRVARRAKVTCLEDTCKVVKALHDGFGKGRLHIRTFQMSETFFTITDAVSSNDQSISYIHLAPHIEIQSVTAQTVITNCGIIDISNALDVEIVDGKVSTTYNTFQSSKIIKIHFIKEMKYRIKQEVL